VRVPMDCWRQWIRHRTANINEYSTRYSLAIDAAQKTKPEEWRLQTARNRQGSEGFIDAERGREFTAREAELQSLARKTYNERIEAGIAREQARKDLPLSTYTEAYWKVDLHNLLHFLSLRMEKNAQVEIRSYATTIGNEIVSRWCPLAWQAFKDYQLGALELSKQEIEIITLLHSGDAEGATNLAIDFGFLPPRGEELKRNIEREEIEVKLQRLGIRPPWLKE
jgi:thymidylate synthase (FAD)